LIPEDDRNRQLADGFVFHDQVNSQIKVMPPAGGWGEVLRVFEKEYVKNLRDYPDGYVVMIIDFDGDYADRRDKFERAVPDDLKHRVFVIGAIQTPEVLKKSIGRDFELIGKALAEDCFADSETMWGHEQLKHNDPDRRRLIEKVKSIIFATE